MPDIMITQGATEEPRTLTQKAGSRSLNGSLDNFEAVLRSERRREPTIRQYLGYVRRLQAFAGDAQSWDQVSRLTVLRFIGTMNTRSPATQNACFWAISKFSDYLCEYEGRPEKLLTGKPPKVSPVPKKSLTGAEILRLVKACQGRVRDEAIIWLLAETGIRRAELAGLRLEDIAIGEKSVIRVMGKGEQARDVPVGGQAAHAITRYLKWRQAATIRLSPNQCPVPNVWRHTPALWLGRNGPMTPSAVYHVVRGAGFRAHVDVTPHRFRNTFANHLLDSGADLENLKVILGHKRIETTLLYTASGAAGRAMEIGRRNSLADRLVSH